MPLQTFFNLPKKQQNQILEISYSEFVNNSYENASLNRIIKAIGIAKGSFYRYFTDKFDLYKFLIDDLNDKNVNDFNGFINENNSNIYDVFKAYLLMIYDFDKQFPKYSAFLYMVSRNRSTPALEKLVLDYESKTNDLFKKLLEIFFSEEKISQPENIHFYAYNLHYILRGLMDYISLKYKINYIDNATKGLPLYNIERSEFEKEVMMHLTLLKNIIEGEQ